MKYKNPNSYSNPRSEVEKVVRRARFEKGSTHLLLAHNHRIGVCKRV